MTDLLQSLLLPQAYQDSDGLISESFTIPASGPYTHQLGSGLSPAYPAGVPLVPAGAAPLSNAPAPTAGAGLTTGNLVTNGVYSWALSLVTKFGETQPTNLLTISGIGVGNTGQTINLPAGTTGTGTNPVLSRRLWRTKNSGSQLYLVAEFDDANVSFYVDEVSDTELITTAPTSNNSGLEGAVSIIGTNGGGTTTWTEMPEGTTLTTFGQFTVSYDISNAGGILTFYSGDHGLGVTAQYSAGTLLGSAYHNLVKTALQTLHDFGIVQLSPASAQTGSINVSGDITAGGKIHGTPATGFRQCQEVEQGSLISLLNGQTLAQISAMSITMTLATDSIVEFDLVAGLTKGGSDAPDLVFTVEYTGAASGSINLGKANLGMIPNGKSGNIPFRTKATGFAAGTYTFILYYTLAAGSSSVTSGTTDSLMTLRITEFA